MTWFAYMWTSRRSKVEMEIEFADTCRIARLNLSVLGEMLSRASAVRF